MSFSGYVKSIPLLIEDSGNANVFKRSKLYIHSYQIQDSNFDENINLSITCMCQEGIFNTNINESNYGGLRKSLDSSSSRDWKEILINEFTTASGQSGDNIQMEARLSTSRDNYDSNTLELIDGIEGEMDDFLVVDIKTSGKLPITLGSIRFGLFDENETKERDPLTQELNIFNWIDLLINRNAKMSKQVMHLENDIETYRNDNTNLKKNYDTCKKDYEMILEDLQDKFFQVLNAKKDKIWELQMKIRKLEKSEDDSKSHIKRPRYPNVPKIEDNNTKIHDNIHTQESGYNFIPSSNVVKTEYELVNELLGRNSEHSEIEPKKDKREDLKTLSTSTVADKSPDVNESFVSTGTKDLNAAPIVYPLIKAESSTSEESPNLKKDYSGSSGQGLVEIKKESDSFPESPTIVNEDDTDYSSEDAEPNEPSKNTQIQSDIETDYSTDKE